MHTYSDKNQIQSPNNYLLRKSSKELQPRFWRAFNLTTPPVSFLSQAKSPKHKKNTDLILQLGNGMQFHLSPYIPKPTFINTINLKEAK